MTIKVKILKENKQISESIDPGMIMAIATALGVSVPIVRSMLDPRSKAEKDLDNARSYIDSKIKKANKGSEKRKKEAQLKAKGYNDKLADLKKERGLQEGLLNESAAMDILNFIAQNPVLLGIGTVAIGTIVSKIKNMMSSDKEISYSEMQKMFADAGVPSGEQLRLEKELKRMKAKAEYERLRGEYKASQNQPEFDPSTAIPRQSEPEETGLAIPIPDEDLKTYVDIINRVSRGEGTTSNPKLQKLINKYGKENLERAAEGMLYEMFKRYI